jgi:hypothetical protein
MVQGLPSSLLRLDSLTALENWLMEICLSSTNDFTAMNAGFIFGNFASSCSLTVFDGLEDS